MGGLFPKIGRNNSKPRCRLNHDLLNEKNQGYYLPSGYILGKRAIEESRLEEKKICPISGKKIKTTEMKKIYFI